MSHPKKIIILGDSTTGKSTLLSRYVYGEFIHIRTTGLNYLFKSVEVNNVKLDLRLFDTSGQERFDSIAKVYFNSCDAVTLMYRKDSLKSFERLSFWLSISKENIRNEVNYYLVCSHNDLTEGEFVPDQLGEKFCDEFGIKGFFKVSSKTGEGVEQLYSKIIKDFCIDLTPKRLSIYLKNKDSGTKKKNCKC